MGSLASSYYDTTVTLYQTTGLNAENEPEFSNTTIRCRLDRQTNRFADGSGNQVICSHVMLCDEEIDPALDYIVTASLEKLIPKAVKNSRDFADGHYEVWLA